MWEKVKTIGPVVGTKPEDVWKILEVSTKQGSRKRSRIDWITASVYEGLLLPSCVSTKIHRPISLLFKLWFFFCFSGEIVFRYPFNSVYTLVPCPMELDVINFSPALAPPSLPWVSPHLVFFYIFTRPFFFSNVQHLTHREAISCIHLGSSFVFM